MLKTLGSFAGVVVLGVTLAGSACSKEEMDRAAQKTKEDAQSAAKSASDAADTSKNTAEKAVDKTKELAVQVADKTKDVAVATADVVTDGWITAKVSAKFKDEVSLEGSDINVDTKDHVVTLKGTVKSKTDKAKAETIAKGTKGVTKVVNQIEVKK